MSLWLRGVRVRLLLAVVVPTSLIFVMLLLMHPVKMENEEQRGVLIYAATPFFGLDMANTNGAFLEVCPADIQSYCKITSDPGQYEKADAILYHQPEYHPESDYLAKRSDQVQVMFSLETPHYYDIKFAHGLINWTMTYRPDSDIPFPYAIFKPRKQETRFKQIWSTKNHSLTAAWLVTNCDTPNKRKELVELAQRQGLAVDIFGRCGRNLTNCDRYAEDRYECAARTLRWSLFDKLRLQQFLPESYVTEKFFNSLRLYYSVPIVIRRQYYEEIGVPSAAFIALDDFNATAEMVQFLNKLKRDKQKYLKYHAWRDHYEVTEYDRSTGFCRLCEKLKEPITQTRNYADLDHWFSKDICNNSYADHYLSE